MAESVDALVSNTSGFTSIPVRPRVWVLKEKVQKTFSFFFMLFFVDIRNDGIFVWNKFKKNEYYEEFKIYDACHVYIGVLSCVGSV